MFLDIETLPADGDKIETLKMFWEDARRKSSVPTKKGENEFQQFFENTSFQGEFGRILCICYGIDDGEIQCLSGDEKNILTKFWAVAKDVDTFVGHNIMEFDLRFIYKRSVIHRIRPSRQLNFARYRSDPIFDTMKEWEKWGAMGISLHKLTICLGIASPKEAGIDGSKVYKYYLDGKSEEIYKYCKRDVEATRAVYKRMTFSE